MSKKTILTTMLVLIFFGVSAQKAVSLDYCRQRAMEANKSMKINNEKKIQAEALRNLAFDQFLPKVSANAAALWSEKSVQLLSDESQENLNTMGTSVASQIVNDMGNGVIAQYLAQTSMMQNLENNLNQVGGDIVSDFNTDTRSMYFGSISITQPIFMGGKLFALYNIASAKAEIENIDYDKAMQDLVIKVDEYYWRVVSVENKYRLAQKYCDLLDTLNSNVAEMLSAGVATESDKLKVQVKLNEAKMQLTQAENGLLLSKMALAQICGMPLDSVFVVADTNLEVNPKIFDNTFDMQHIYENRDEMLMLNQAGRIANEGVKIARSTFMPNLVATGGYLISNPNIYNGFDKSFNGMFYGGLVMNFPIAHPSSFHSLKLAKSKQREVEYQITEAKEKIRLQVTQIEQQRKVATRRYIQAESNIKNAGENLRLAEASFEAGVLSASELMEAQTAWQKAYSEKIDAAIDLRVSEIYLKQAIGEK